MPSQIAHTSLTASQCSELPSCSHFMNCMQVQHYVVSNSCHLTLFYVEREEGYYH